MAEASYAFPLHARLCKPFEYKRVFSNPLKISGKYFTLLACMNEFEHSRLGLAVTKKNIRKAVARNRLKRIIRESFRMHQYQLGSYDVVVLAKSTALDSSWVQLSSALHEQWLRLKTKCSA